MYVERETRGRAKESTEEEKRDMPAFNSTQNDRGPNRMKRVGLGS